MERHEQAPTVLTDVQKFEIQNHPDIVKLVKLRKMYVRKIKKHDYPTIKTAKGTWWYRRYGETQRKLNSLRQKLSSELLEKTVRSTTVGVVGIIQATRYPDTQE